MYCTCLGATTFLCFEDLGRHCAKWPGLFHQNFPIQTLPFQRLPGYFERLQARMVGLEQGKKALLGSLETVDSAIRLYEEACGRLVELVTEQRSRGLEGLRKVREEIEARVQEAIAEAAALIYEDQAEPMNPLGGLFRSPVPEDFSLLTFSIAEESAARAIANMLKYQVQPPLNPAASHPLDRAVADPMQPDPSLLQSSGPRVDPPIREIAKLPRVDPTNFRFFNFSTRVWQPEIQLTRTIDCDEGTSYVALGELTIFCCGGNCNGQYSSAVYLLEAGGKVTTLKGLPTRRGFAGVILVGDCTYIFGGIDRSGSVHSGLLQVCSRIRVRGPRVWEEMPDLQHGRAHFSPCLYHNLIYLFGGCHRDSIEAFSPTALTICTLRAKMFTEINPACSVWVHNEELCVLTEFNYARYRLKGTEIALTSSLSHHNNWKPSPNCPPAVCGDFAFIVQAKECSWCNVHTGQLVGYH